MNPMKKMAPILTHSSALSLQ